MLNLNTNWVSEAIKYLHQWQAVIKTNFQAIQTAFNNHLAGIGERHNAQGIDYSGDMAGDNVKNALDNHKNAVSGSRHNAQDISYSGIVAGNNTKAALDNLQGEINNLSFTGSEHDALVTSSLIDEEGEDFGPEGNETYLNGRLLKWEQKQLSHLSEIVSVLNPPSLLIAAKGDGITDDTTALTNLFNNTNYNEFTIVNEGYPYIISSPIVINRSNIKIRGIGNPIIKLKNGSTTAHAMIVTDGTTKTDIHIKGIVFDANREYNINYGLPDANGNYVLAEGMTYVIGLSLTTKFSVKDCTIKNSWGGGIFVADCWDGLIDKNTVSNYRTTGIAVQNATSIVGVPSDVIISRNKCYGGVVGIHNIFGCEYVKIIENTLYNNRDSNAFPPFAFSGTYPNVYPTTGGFKSSSDSGYVSNARLGDGAGIEFTGKFTDPAAIPNQYSLISGNTCRNNQVGIRLEEETQYVAVTNNQCNFNDTYGIFNFSSIFNEFIGNYCLENGLDGIRIEKTSGMLTPIYIIIKGNHLNKNRRFGVTLVGSRAITIEGNNLSDNNTDTSLIGGCIGLFYSDGIACERNIISTNTCVAYSGNDKYGVYSNNAANGTNIITGNIFEALVVAALNLDKTTNTINGNIGYKTTNYGTSKITAGQTFVSIAHGMPFIPGNGELLVTPVTNILGKFWYIGSADATNFTIIIDSIAASDIYFNWCVVEDKG